MGIMKDIWKLEEYRFTARMDAPQTDCCCNRCCVRIYLFYLIGENPDTKATAAASPQSVRPLRCLRGGSYSKSVNP